MPLRCADGRLGAPAVDGSRPRPASFRFALALDVLRAEGRADGPVVFSRGDGPPVPVLPKPFMTDSAADVTSPYARALRWAGGCGGRQERGVNHETLRNWVIAAERAGAGQPDGTEQMVQLARLQQLCEESVALGALLLCQLDRRAAAPADRRQ